MDIPVRSEDMIGSRRDADMDVDDTADLGTGRTVL